MDREGPTDSAEALRVTDAYDPYGPVLIWDPLPRTLTYDVFEAWALIPASDWDHDPFLFWFRPPEPHLFSEPLPSDWSAFADDLAKARGVGAATMWETRYQPFSGVLGVADLDRQLEIFWYRRVAINTLSTVASNQTAYVRIQSQEDHAQPDHMLQRHAIKALNAAFEGNERHVYYAGAAGYWDDIIHGVEPTPDKMASAFDIDNPDRTGGDTSWGDVDDFWPLLPEYLAWGTQVDLVRWAVQTSFSWLFEHLRAPPARLEPLDPTDWLVPDPVGRRIPPL